MGGTRLVVLHDPARGERVDVDPVDLPRDREAAEVDAALELRRGPLAAEGHLEAPRDERQPARGVLPDEVLEVPGKRALELEQVDLGEVDPDLARDRLREAFAEELDAPPRAGPDPRRRFRTASGSPA